MATATTPSNTVVTENDKLNAARLKDAEANLKATKDVDPAERTVSHANLLPSTIEGFAIQYGLTVNEAEKLLVDNDGDAVASAKYIDDVKAGRYVYKQAYVKEPAGSAHPLSPTVDVPAIPVAPTAAELDPYAPKGDEPTAAVIDAEVEGVDVQERADEFAAQAEEAIEAVDEAAAAADEK